MTGEHALALPDGPFAVAWWGILSHLATLNAVVAPGELLEAAVPPSNYHHKTRTHASQICT